MSNAPSTGVCMCHTWERQLETHDGVECVVRVCVGCGRKELCWSRRGLSSATAAALKSGVEKQAGRHFGRG